MEDPDEANGPTPHLEGTRGDYAPTVLVPGDPKRARFIADEYLSDVRQVNTVRGADGYTGTYEEIPVSVQAVGMGVPSALIYYTELIRFYGVRRLIRVGSAGGIAEDTRLGQIIIASGAGTDSAAIETVNEGLTLAPVADWPMLRDAVAAADRLSVGYQVGPVFTADLFYGPDPTLFEKLGRHGVLGVEMEIAALYAIAAAEGARALGLVTVSDDIVRGERMSAADRENTFDAMMRVALETARAAA